MNGATFWPGNPPRFAVYAFLVLVVVLAPIPTVARIRTTFLTEPSFGDLATEEMATIEAAHGARSVGQWSRFGFFQPGPFLFYLMAPVYVIAGLRPFGLAITVFLLNWSCLVAVLWFCSRRLAQWSGPFLAIPLLLSSLGFLRSGNREFVFDWWNNFVIVFPFGVLLFVSAGLACGEAKFLPWLVVLTSFLGQTQMAALPAGLVVALLGLMFFLRSGAWKTAAGRRTVAVACLVLTVLWALPVIGEFGGRPGNLGAIAAFARSSRQSQPFGEALRTVTVFLAGPVTHVTHGARWSGGSAGSPIGPAAVIGLLEVACLTVSAMLARRRRALFSERLCEICLAATGAAIWAVTRIPGEVHPYLLVWIVPLGVVNIIVAGSEIGAAGIRSILRDPRPEARPRSVWLAVSLTAAGLVLVWLAPQPRSLGIPSVRPVCEMVSADLRNQAVKPMAVRLVSDEGVWPWTAAVGPVLYRAGGWRPCFDPPFPAGWATPWWSCEGRTLTYRIVPRDVRNEDGVLVGCVPITPSWGGVSVICVKRTM